MGEDPPSWWGCPPKPQLRAPSSCFTGPNAWTLRDMPRTATKKTAKPLISLLVVDDHPMWRDTLRKVLEHSRVARVVAEAPDGEQAVVLAASTSPDVVLMDMGLPRVNGVDATRNLRAAHPGIKILVLSSSEERDDVIAAVKAGASGYLVKTASSDEVSDAVLRVHAGELVFPPALARVVLEEFQRSASPQATPTAIRIALASQAPLMREAFARLLADVGFDVDTIVERIEDLPAAIANRPPDVAVLDVPVEARLAASAFATATAIREAHPGVGVLVLCQQIDTADALRLVSNGSRGLGYVLRDRVTNLEDLGESIRRVARGESVIDPNVVSKLVEEPSGPNALAHLTEREHGVLALMAEGRSNQAISERLFLSGKTVEKHVRAIFTKLDLEETPDDHRRILAVLTYLRSI